MIKPQDNIQCAQHSSEGNKNMLCEFLVMKTSSSSPTPSLTPAVSELRELVWLKSYHGRDLCKSSASHTLVLPLRSKMKSANISTRGFFRRHALPRKTPSICTCVVVWKRRPPSEAGGGVGESRELSCNVGFLW